MVDAKPDVKPDPSICMRCWMQGVRLSLQQAEMELAGRQQQMVAVEVRCCGPRAAVLAVAPSRSCRAPAKA